MKLRNVGVDVTSTSSLAHSPESAICAPAVVSPAVAECTAAAWTGDVAVGFSVAASAFVVAVSEAVPVPFSCVFIAIVCCDCLIKG